MRGLPDPGLSQPNAWGALGSGALKKPPDKWATKIGLSFIGGQGQPRG